MNGQAGKTGGAAEVAAEGLAGEIFGVVDAGFVAADGLEGLIENGDRRRGGLGPQERAAGRIWRQALAWPSGRGTRRAECCPYRHHKRVEPEAQGQNLTTAVVRTASATTIEAVQFSRPVEGQKHDARRLGRPRSTANRV